MCVCECACLSFKTSFSCKIQFFFLLKILCSYLCAQFFLNVYNKFFSISVQNLCICVRIYLFNYLFISITKCGIYK